MNHDIERSAPDNDTLRESRESTELQAGSTLKPGENPESAPESGKQPSYKRGFPFMTRNLLLLGFVSLFTDLSSQIAFPLLPLFMADVLKAPAAIVGLVEGAAEASASLLKVISGYWSDRVRRRKPFILVGYSFSSLTKPLFGLTHSWPLVLILRVVERFGKGLRDAPRDAIIAESVNRRYFGRAFGFQRAMDGIGSMLGALIAFILLPILGFRNLFFLTFVFGVISVLFILPLKEREERVESGEREGRENEAAPAAGERETPPEKPPESPGSGKQQKKPSLRSSWALLPGYLKLFIAASAFFALGNYGYAFLLLRARAGAGNEYALLMYVVFYLAYTVFTMPAGAVADRRGSKFALYVGYLIFALVSAGLYAIPSVKYLPAFFVLFGVFFAFTDGVQRAFVAHAAPKDLKATALGAFHTAVGLAALPGGYIAGFLWDRIRPEATFAYGFVMVVISVFLLALVKVPKGSGEQKAG